MTVSPLPLAAPAATRPHPWLAWLALPACVLVALLVYGPSLWTAGFVNFDDPFYFGPDNALFRAASAAAQQHGVFAGLGVVCDPRQLVADVYLPVAHGSLWLDLWWFGGDPFGPHLVAALLHGLAGFVLCRWLLSMRIVPAVAVVATLLFLVHPAMCESVAWVSGRKDVLCGLFVFAALWLCARAAVRPTAWTLVGIAACGVLAMYSKSTAVVQPLLAALVCAYTGGARRRWLAPLVLLLVTAPIALHHQLNAAAQGTLVAGSVGARLPQVPGALAHYLQTALWPSGLNVLYPELKTLDAFTAHVWPALLVVAATVLAGVLAWRRPSLRPLGLGVLGFWLALLPFNTAFPASVIAVADRYLYLALPFLALAVVTALALLLRRRAWLGAALAVPLLAAAWGRAPAFASSASLWTASLEQDGDNAVALLNLLGDQWSSGRFDLPTAMARSERAAAVARYPEHERRARLWLAQFALAENRNEDAVLQLEHAVAATERIAGSGRVARAQADALLAGTLLQQITPLRLLGRGAAARAAYARAAQLAPDDPQVRAAGVLLDVDALADEVRKNGGQPPADDDPRVVALEQHVAAARSAVGVDAQVEYAAGMFARLRGRSVAAIACFRRAVERREDFADGWLGAAEVCLDAGICDEAEVYARGGLGVSRRLGTVADPRLRLALARALKGQGRLGDAIESMRVYVEQQPRDRDAARLYSGLLMHRARERLTDPDITHAELQGLIDRALAANPQEPAVDLVRAKMYRDQRRFADAVDALDRLAKAVPDLEEPPGMLAECLRDLGYERLFAKDDAGAVAAWRRFLQVAPKDLDQEPVRMQLQGIWRRHESRGIEARAAGDRKRAEAEFRTCLAIDPDQHWAAWLLCALLVDDAAADLAELDRLSEQAIAWQIAHHIDRSRQVAVRAAVLGRMNRESDARVLVDGYLAAPDTDAPRDVLDLLRTMQRER
jgi:tetratricopeptide (TPR) repeat protein